MSSYVDCIAMIAMALPWRAYPAVACHGVAMALPRHCHGLALPQPCCGHVVPSRWRSHGRSMAWPCHRFGAVGSVSESVCLALQLPLLETSLPIVQILASETFKTNREALYIIDAYVYIYIHMYSYLYMYIYI